MLDTGFFADSLAHQRAWNGARATARQLRRIEIVVELF